MFSYKRVFILSFIVVSILFSLNLAHSATITVKQLGGGDYTTIGEAIQNANPDDTIEVYAGRYEEAVVIDKNLTLIGLGPQVVTIYSPSIGITIQNNVRATIVGFTITSAETGVNLEDLSDTVIRNNLFVSNGGYGLYGYYRAKSSISNNVFAFNAYDGIFGQSRPGYGDTIEFNIFNNISYSNGYCGINLYGNSKCGISYNDVYANSSGDYCGCSAGTGDISQNPDFFDSSNGNYVLKSTSVCVNSGRPGAADADPDGSRNDLGAYGGPDAAPFWPYPPGGPIITNLTVAPTSVAQGSTLTINATGEVYE